jgi:hypothetical protein
MIDVISDLMVYCPSSVFASQLSEMTISGSACKKGIWIATVTIPIKKINRNVYLFMIIGV